MKRSIAYFVRIYVLVGALGCALASRAYAHGPIFVTHVETPGKHALDLDTHIMSAPGGVVSIDPALLLGLSRAVALSISPALQKAGSDSKLKAEGLGGALKWRFWNRDSFGMKQATAVDLGTHAKTHHHVDKGHTLHRNYHAAVGYGIEHVHFNFNTGIRYTRLSGEEGLSGSSRNQYAADIGAGYRFYPIRGRALDVTAFLGFSRKLHPVQGSYISPELWFSPFPRMLLKVGYQLRIGHSHSASTEGSSTQSGSGMHGQSLGPSDAGHAPAGAGGAAEPRGVWGYGMEIRF